MNISKRWILASAVFLTLVISMGAQWSFLSGVFHSEAEAANPEYTPVVTPNGATLPYKMDGKVKVFELTVEVCRQEIAPGMVINAWCYNGRTPGPTIEAVEGDRVRILVTNKLPEATAVHWHGILLPSGMDGVQGLNQKGIPPGDTFKYEFTLIQHGTQMYHSHGDEMVQMGMGSMGFFIIHPKKAPYKIDRDYAIFLNEWFVEPGSMTPDPNVMTDFNIFTFNSRSFPGTAPLVARPGERVRVRIGHVGQDFHAIHMHGHTFKIVATDGGDIPESAQQPETTVAIGPGQTRDYEFIAIPGDWALHCHLRHHPMNAMGHPPEVPHMLGVNQDGVEDKIKKLVPGYMAMGETGMGEHAEHAAHMEGPPNTLPMMGGDGPFGNVGMGGMFTILKVHEDIPYFNTAEEYNEQVKLPGDLGWYDNPPGTVAESIYPAGPPNDIQKAAQESIVYSCPMHPEIQQFKPGNCPKCGMTLKAMPTEKKGNANEHENHQH